MGERVVEMLMEYIYCLIYVTGLSICIYKYLDRKPKLLELICILLIYGFINFVITNKITFDVMEQIFMSFGIILSDFIMISIMNRKINWVLFNYTLFYSSLNIFIITISLFVMNNYFPFLIEKTHTITSYRFSIIIIFNIINILIWRLLERKNFIVHKKIIKNYLNLFLIVNGISQIILIIFQYFSYTLELNIYTNFLLIIFAILWFYFIYIISKYTSLSYEHENMLLSESISQNIEQYMIQYKSNQEKVNKLRHDIKNHFILIKEMSHNQEVIHYIEQMFPELEKIRIEDKEISGHLYIDAIIHTRQLMYDNVQVIGEFTNIKDLKLNELDLSLLLFNLLDNAFQASHEVNGYVKIEMKYDDCHLILRIENNCKGKTDFKSRKINHGYGLKIVRDIVEKYDGTIDFISQENIVIVKVGLNI